MPKVSILTPTYQQAGYIRDCILSVLAQTEGEWEMVIVDDGSDDGTPEIAESFRDPRIRVLRRDHEGVVGLGRSYALALASSTSPLVAILEGDDTWPPDKLEVEIPLFEDSGVVLAYGSAGLIDSEGCIYGRYWHKPPTSVGDNVPVGSILPALIRLNFIVAATVMVRRTALDDVGGFFQPEGVPYVDLPTWLRLGTVGRFKRSSSDLGNWRRHPSQVTTQSWFDDARDRTSYLRAIAVEAQSVVDQEVSSSLNRAILRDSSRQHEEASIARGRTALLAGQWEIATTSFGEVGRNGDWRTRAVAIAGMACAKLKIDMEFLIARVGRHSLPSRRHVASHSRPGAFLVPAEGNSSSATASHPPPGDN